MKAAISTLLAWATSVQSTSCSSTVCTYTGYLGRSNFPQCNFCVQHGACTASLCKMRCLVASCLIVIAMCWPLCWIWAGSKVGRLQSTSSHLGKKDWHQQQVQLEAIQPEVRLPKVHYLLWCKKCKWITTNPQEGTSDLNTIADTTAETASYAWQGVCPPSKNRLIKWCSRYIMHCMWKASVSGFPLANGPANLPSGSAAKILVNSLIGYHKDEDLVECICQQAYGLDLLKDQVANEGKCPWYPKQSPSHVGKITWCLGEKQFPGFQLQHLHHLGTGWKKR